MWLGPPHFSVYSLENSQGFQPNITSLDRITWAENKRDLTIKSLGAADAGTYVCQHGHSNRNAIVKPRRK